MGNSSFLDAGWPVSPRVEQTGGRQREADCEPVCVACHYIQTVAATADRMPLLRRSAISALPVARVLPLP